LATDGEATSDVRFVTLILAGEGDFDFFGGMVERVHEPQIARCGMRAPLLPTPHHPFSQGGSRERNVG
jgi:hypothetical protein